MRKLLGFLTAATAVGVGAFAAFKRHGSPLSGARGRRTNLRGEHEVRELQLFCENDGDIYRQQISMIEKNLKRRMEKGQYDHTKAQKLWMYAADNCARKYGKEFGSPGVPWHKMFSTADRREVAKNFADSFRDEHLSVAKHGHTPGGRSR